MRVGLLQNTLNVIGGAERFTVDLIKVLKDGGHEVHLATFDKVDWGCVEQNMGRCIKPDRCFSIFWKRLPIFGIYQRLLMVLAVKRLAKSVDITINTHSDHLFCRTDIVYMHGVNPTLSWNLKVPWWKVPYVLPYAIVTWIALKRKKPNAFFITNSYHSGQKLLKLHGIQAKRVIYPPVHTEVYRQLSEETDREDLVLTISRYAKEKDLDHIIEIAKLTKKSIRFILVGQTANRFEEAIARSLMEKAESLPIEFLVNISQEEKRMVMAKAKVYLHVSSFEHFGLSVCESISAGCIPVAVNEGGHLEILEFAKPFAYTYNSFEEAAYQVEKAVEAWTPTTACFISSRMEHFNLDRFADEMLQVVEGFK